MTDDRETRVQDIGEVMTDWFWRTDSSHRFTEVYRPFATVHDKALVADFLGKARWEIPGSTPITGPWSELATLMDARQPIRGFEYAFHQRDGTERILVINGEPFFGDDGAFLGYRGVSQDISVLPRIREERDKAERLFLHAVESIPVAIALFDPEDRLILWNRHYATNLAPAVQLVEGMTLEDILRLVLANDLIAEAKEHEDEWLQRRMALHRAPGETFDQRFGSRWLQIGEHRSADGFTMVIAHDVTAERAAEQELRHQQNLVETIIEHLPLAVFWKDRNGVYLGCNRNFVTHRGLNGKEQVIGKRLHDFAVESGEADIATENDRRVIATGEPLLNIEETLTRDDGSRLEVLSSKVPLRDSDDEVLGVVGIFADITDRKQAEVELAASEARFRDLIERSIHGIYIHRATKPLFVNQACADIFGYARPEDIVALGSTRSLYMPTDWRRMRTYARRRLAGKKAPTRYQVRGVKTDGSVVWIELEVRVVDWYGAPAFQTTLVDITARKQAETTLRESEEFLRAITGSLIDAIVMVDDKGNVAFWNEAAERMFGYDTAEATGKPVHDLLAPRQYREEAGKGFRHFVDTGDGPVLGKTVSLRAQRRDGSEFPVDLSIAPLDRQGCRHAVAVIRDMTERLQAEQQLRQAQRMRALGNLAGGVAHELNNLLLPILTLSQMTMKAMPADSRERQKLAKIVEASERAQDLVSRVMDFSRQEDGVLAEIDIHHTVKDAMAFLTAALPATVTIKEELDDAAGIVHADPSQIQTILMNLGSNAVDACEGRPGTITVFLAPVVVDADEASRISGLETGRYARLTVTDTGRGMDTETLERAFEPFFTTKEVGEGTGLGLAVVHGIVERHGGVIHVASTVGKGTTVDIYFPLRHDND